MLKHSYCAAVLISSDKGASGERKDESGPLICELLKAEGYKIAETALLPDDEEMLSAQLEAWALRGDIRLILTTGGTGLSPRDCMPEATLKIAARQVPGIAEAMRSYSMTITPRAMLSRAVAAICGTALIINLPGSPKAVGETLNFLLPVLEHALDTLTGQSVECARKD